MTVVFGVCIELLAWSAISYLESPHMIYHGFNKKALPFFTFFLLSPDPARSSAFLPSLLPQVLHSSSDLHFGALAFRPRATEGIF